MISWKNTDCENWWRMLRLNMTNNQALRKLELENEKNKSRKDLIQQAGSTNGLSRIKMPLKNAEGFILLILRI
jgi:hypothetical protein